MTFDKESLRTLRGALHAAIAWEEDLAEANEHILVEFNKCQERIVRYRRLLNEIVLFERKGNA